MASARLTAAPELGDPSTARKQVMPGARAKRWLAPFIVASLAAIVVFVPSMPALCPMRLVLRVPCPSCGLTRAARLASMGHFAEATRMHPLWFIVLPLFLVVVVVECAGFVRTGDWGSAMRSRWTPKLASVVVALLIIVWIARWFGAFGGPAPV